MSGLLGYIVAYTISTGSGSPNLDITREDLEDWFKELGLERALIPASKHAIDAFRNATSTQGPEYKSDDGLRYRLIVREHTNEPDLVIRMVMRQGLEPGAEIRHVATIKFYKQRRTSVGKVAGSEDVKVTLHAGLNGVDRAVVAEFTELLLQRYESLRRQLDPHRVRALLRGYLFKLHGVPVMPGGNGIYFIPARHGETARSLRTFVARCGADCKMLLASVLDDEEQREMVRSALDREVDDRARKMLQLINDWHEKSPTKPPPNGMAKAWNQEEGDLRDLVVSYAENYDMSFPQAADSLEELRAAIQDITRRMVATLRR